MTPNDRKSVEFLTLLGEALKHLLSNFFLCWAMLYYQFMLEHFLWFGLSVYCGLFCYLHCWLLCFMCCRNNSDMSICYSVTSWSCFHSFFAWFRHRPLTSIWRTQRLLYTYIDKDIKAKFYMKFPLVLRAWCARTVNFVTLQPTHKQSHFYFCTPNIKANNSTQTSTNFPACWK